MSEPFSFSFEKTTVSILDKTLRVEKKIEDGAIRHELDLSKVVYARSTVTSSSSRTLGIMCLIFGVIFLLYGWMSNTPSGIIAGAFFVLLGVILVFQKSNKTELELTIEGKNEPYKLELDTEPENIYKIMEHINTLRHQ